MKAIELEFVNKSRGKAVLLKRLENNLRRNEMNVFIDMICIAFHPTDMNVSLDSSHVHTPY